MARRLMDKVAVEEVIAEMRRHTKSKQARVRLAQLALTRDNLTEDGRSAWETFLAGEGE